MWRAAAQAGHLVNSQWFCTRLSTANVIGLHQPGAQQLWPPVKDVHDSAIILPFAQQMVADFWDDFSAQFKFEFNNDCLPVMTTHL